MARKFGKVNKIKVNPLAYNVGIIAPSGFGKSTLMKEVCEELSGGTTDSYMIFNTGMEMGVDAIVNASYEDIPDWDTFDEIVEDIVENKLTDYNELKCVVIDTMDELFRITEAQVVRLHNKAHPDKQVKSISGAFGGYGRGEDKSIEIVLEKIKQLKDVGVSVWFVGHTKKRTLTDVVTGIEYDMLTTNMTMKYFNAILTKLHVLGVGSVDRDITQAKSGKKDFNGKDKIVGSINSAQRKITFRDDNFNIDSKSRFPNIVDSIEFSKEAFITALTDAIKAEFDKQSGVKSMEEELVIQEKEKESKVEETVEKAQAKSTANQLKEAVSEINQFLKDNRTKSDVIKPIIAKLKEIGVSKASEIEDITQATEILELCK